jgi:hypothetical protein
MHSPPEGETTIAKASPVDGLLHFISKNIHDATHYFDLVPLIVRRKDDTRKQMFPNVAFTPGFPFRSHYQISTKLRRPYAFNIRGISIWRYHAQAAIELPDAY